MAERDAVLEAIQRGHVDALRTLLADEAGHAEVTQALRQAAG